MAQELQKTDPRVRIGMLQEAEREMLEQIQKYEEALRKLLAELRATRALIEEAHNDMESAQVERVQETQEEIDRQTQALEEVLASSVEERQVQEEEDHIVQQNVVQYQAATDQAAQKIETAGSRQTIDRLMNLAYTDNWSQQQAQEFFTLQDTITDTMNYDLNPALRENVSQSYQALQAVRERAKNQIQQNYNPGLAPPPQQPSTNQNPARLFSPATPETYKPQPKKELDDIL